MHHYYYNIDHRICHKLIAYTCTHQTFDSVHGFTAYNKLSINIGVHLYPPKQRPMHPLSVITTPPE